MKLKDIDHIALQSENPRESANWYAGMFGGRVSYCDDSWSIVEFGNIKLSFVIPEEHPSHIAFEISSFEEGDVVKRHRDGSMSSYRKDSWGNIYELISYEEGEI